MQDDDTSRTRLVWDLPLRLTHWALAILVAGSWATHYAGARWTDWHARCGYAVLVLVARCLTARRSSAPRRGRSAR